MLQLKNVGLDYISGKNIAHALRRINLTLPERGLVLFTGGALAGKTALLRVLAMIDLPSRGEVAVDGENTAPARQRGPSPFSICRSLAADIPESSPGRKKSGPRCAAPWPENRSCC